MNSLTYKTNIRVSEHRDFRVIRRNQNKLFGAGTSFGRSFLLVISLNIVFPKKKLSLIPNYNHSNSFFIIKIHNLAHAIYLYTPEYMEKYFPISY